MMPKEWDWNESINYVSPMANAEREREFMNINWWPGGSGWDWEISNIQLTVKETHYASSSKRGKVAKIYKYNQIISWKWSGKTPRILH